MRLISEISKLLAAEGLDFTRVQYTVINGRGGYFQNVKKLVEFSETKIVVAGKKGAVSIEGEGFSLGKYYAGDLVVYGDIARAERVDRGKP